MASDRERIDLLLDHVLNLECQIELLEIELLTLRDDPETFEETLNDRNE